MRIALLAALALLATLTSSFAPPPEPLPEGGSSLAMLAFVVAALLGFRGRRS